MNIGDSQGISKSYMGINLAPRKYVPDLLKVVGLSGSHQVDVPMDWNKKLVKDTRIC